jgi:hypothetical protein
MPPVVWKLQGKLLVVKLVASYTTEQLFQAFGEAIASPECQVGTALLVDARSAIDYITPTVLSDRVQFVFDSIRSRISRCAIAGSPPYVATFAEASIRQLQALGMDARAFTDIRDARAWLESP